jgi:hypothetical protein
MSAPNPTSYDDEDDPFAPESPRPFWRCESCGYENRTRPMPPDRERFYKRTRFPLCPKCKSESFMPVGF